MSFVLWLWLVTASGRPVSTPVVVGTYASRARCEVVLAEWLARGRGRFAGFCEEPLRQIP